MEILTSLTEASVLTDGKLVVSASGITKTYAMGEMSVDVLKNVNFNVAEGEFTVISGPSGSGKTTLLNIIGTIDKPTAGKITVLGEDVTIQTEDLLATFRSRNVGFVFQSYNLISTLTAAENVAFPMEWVQKPDEETQNRVKELLKKLELQERFDHFPSQLSGGEQQRVALARALANDPPLLLLDEPTGNLDTKTGFKIIRILEELKHSKKTIVAATHDERISDLADQCLFLEDGVLAAE